MILPRLRVSVSSRRFLAMLVAVTGILTAPRPAQPSEAAQENDLFNSTNLLRISIEIPEDDVQTLRASRTMRLPQEKPKAQATVTEGNRVYNNVTVQLKGYTSFQSIDRLPNLTLNFDKFAPGQRFHGLTKLSLNNSVQDPTRLNEKLSRELFAAAGVPVPCADHALVTLNGRDLGLYVVTEGFDKTFLKRHFERTDGNLYEAGVLQDIDRPLQVDSGRNPTNHAAVLRLIAAAREPDSGKRFKALATAVDMERFLSMVAIETILCHSDSYSMNRNNYRLYHNPDTDKIVFMPHGMDRVLGMHRSTLDLPLVPPTLGLVARAVLSTPEGRRRYVERASVLFTNLFDPAKLGRRVREIDARILSAKLTSPANRASGENFSGGRVRDVENLCDRIATRAAELKTQLADVSDLLTPPPRPDFDADGLARIDRWKPKPRPNHPEVFCEAIIQDGKEVLHLRMPKGPFTTSLCCRIALSAGTYVIAGQIEIKGDPASSISAAVVRNSSERFAVQRQRLDSRRLNFSFEVAESRAPEEIEFVCDIQSDAPEVTIDASSLRLIRRSR